MTEVNAARDSAVRMIIVNRDGITARKLITVYQGRLEATGQVQDFQRNPAGIFKLVVDSYGMSNTKYPITGWNRRGGERPPPDSQQFPGNYPCVNIRIVIPEVLPCDNGFIGAVVGDTNRIDLIAVGSADRHSAWA